MQLHEVLFLNVAIFDFLKDNNEISESYFIRFYTTLEVISKMLYALIKGLNR